MDSPKNHQVCSICKRPILTPYPGREPIIQERIPRDHKGLSFHLVLTHKSCEESYNEAAFQILRPTISRERGDLADEDYTSLEYCEEPLNGE